MYYHIIELRQNGKRFIAYGLPEPVKNYLDNSKAHTIVFEPTDTSSFAQLDWYDDVGEDVIEDEELISELVRYSNRFYTDPDDADPDDLDGSRAYLKLTKYVDGKYQEAYIKRFRPAKGCQHNFGDFVRSFCQEHFSNDKCFKCGKFRCCVEEEDERMLEEKRRRIEEKKRSGLGKKRRHSRKKRHSKKK